MLRLLITLFLLTPSLAFGESGVLRRLDAYMSRRRQATSEDVDQIIYTENWSGVYASCSNEEMYCTGIQGVDQVLHDADIKHKSNVCSENSVYTWEAFCESLGLMTEVDEDNEKKHFFLGGKKSKNHAEGLVNIASFLSQAMFETGGTSADGVAFNYCDENPHLSVEAGRATSSCTQREYDRAPYTSTEQNMWQPGEKSCGEFEQFSDFYNHYSKMSIESTTGPKFMTVFDVEVTATVTLLPGKTLSAESQEDLREAWCQEWDQQAPELKTDCNDYTLPAEDSHSKWIVDCYAAGVEEGESLCGCPHWNPDDLCFTSTDFDKNGYEHVDGLHPRECPARVVCDIVDAGQQSDRQTFELTAKAVFPEAEKPGADSAVDATRTQSVLDATISTASFAEDVESYVHTSGSYSDDKPNGGTVPKLQCSPDVNPACCWWGRGAIQVTGPTNVYDLKKNTLDKITSIAEPDKDICERPGLICEDERLKWLSAISFWVRNVQTEKQFPESLKNYVANDFTDVLESCPIQPTMNPDCEDDVSFTHGCGGAVNNGIWTQHAHAENFRTDNFLHLIGAMKDAPGNKLERDQEKYTGTTVLQEPTGNPINPRSRCGDSWEDANSKCSSFCDPNAGEDACQGSQCWSNLDFDACFPECQSDNDCPQEGVTENTACKQISVHGVTEGNQGTAKKACCPKEGWYHQVAGWGVDNNIIYMNECPVPDDFLDYGELILKGQGAWVVDDSDPVTQSLPGRMIRSGDIGDDMESTIDLLIKREECIAGCRLTFQFRLDSEGCGVWNNPVQSNGGCAVHGDVFSILRDGELGTGEWMYGSDQYDLDPLSPPETLWGPDGHTGGWMHTLVLMILPEYFDEEKPEGFKKGEVVITFKYEKDGSIAHGEDRAWIKDLTLKRLDEQDPQQQPYAGLDAGSEGGCATKIPFANREWDPRWEATTRCGASWEDAQATCGRNADVLGSDACYPKDKYTCYAVSTESCSDALDTDPRRGATLRCGWTQEHAENTCGKLCSEAGEECFGAGDGFCFGGLTDRSDNGCGAGTMRCGASFDEAETHCGPSCSVNSGCERCVAHNDCAGKCGEGCTGDRECQCMTPSIMEDVEAKLFSTDAGAQRYCQCVQKHPPRSLILDHRGNWEEDESWFSEDEICAAAVACGPNLTRRRTHEEPGSTRKWTVACAKPNKDTRTTTITFDTNVWPHPIFVNTMGTDELWINSITLTEQDNPEEFGFCGGRPEESAENMPGGVYTEQVYWGFESENDGWCLSRDRWDPAGWNEDELSPQIAWPTPESPQCFALLKLNVGDAEGVYPDWQEHTTWEKYKMVDRPKQVETWYGGQLYHNYDVIFSVKNYMNTEQGDWSRSCIPGFKKPNNANTGPANHCRIDPVFKGETYLTPRAQANQAQQVAEASQSEAEIAQEAHDEATAAAEAQRQESSDAQIVATQIANTELAACGAQLHLAQTGDYSAAAVQEFADAAALQAYNAQQQAYAAQTAADQMQEAANAVQETAFAVQQSAFDAQADANQLMQLANEAESSMWTYQSAVDVAQAAYDALQWAWPVDEEASAAALVVVEEAQEALEEAQASAEDVRQAADDAQDTAYAAQAAADQAQIAADNAFQLADSMQGNAFNIQGIANQVNQVAIQIQQVANQLVNQANDPNAFG